MNKSETITNLAAALAKAQAEMPPAGFDASNPFLKNRYASRGSVIDTAKPVLQKHGLSVVQMSVSAGDSIGVTTILMHESGEWIEGTITLPVGEEKGKSSAQVAGSIITYLRRYSLASALNMYADEDTDGNQPQAKKSNGAKPQPKAQPAQVSASMTLETALSMTDSKGEKYGDMNTQKLANYANGISVALRKDDVDDDKRAELEQERDAIAVILADRNA